MRITGQEARKIEHIKLEIRVITKEFSEEELDTYTFEQLEAVKYLALKGFKRDDICRFIYLGVYIHPSYFSMSRRCVDGTH